VILQPIKKKRPAEDDSFVGVRVGVLLLAALALFCVLAFRLWYLQILSGDDYVSYATSNRVRQVVVEAPRGVVYDRNGEVLVENRAGLSVGILPMDMWDEKESPHEFYAEIVALSDVLDMSVAVLLDDFNRAKKDPYVTYIVKEDVPENTVVAYLKEHSSDFRGVEVEKTFLRQYRNGALAAHLLGYVGEVSKRDLEQTEFAELKGKGGVHIGKDGVERTYDSYLRGTDGWKTVQVDASGRPLDFIEDVSAIAGNNLTLTINSRLQKEAENAILEGIERAHNDDYGKAAAGAVVALDPRTGEVLALASYPDYDPSLFVGGIDQTAYDALSLPEAHYPLFDRAVNGLYPAGSTFKPFVAAVALQAGVVTPNTIIYCDGRYSANKQTWKCWNTDGHGDVNLAQAIEHSCDVFFYNLGYAV
jgi:penicillin-binding protein 2